MNFLKGGILVAGLMSSIQVFAQAEMFLFAEDEASITVTKTLLEDGTFSYESRADTPELLDINYVICQPTACSFELVLKQNGPVDFTGFNVHKWTPYAYAGITSPDIAIDLDFFGITEILLADAYTFPSLDPNAHAEFVPVNIGNALASVISVEGPYVTISGFFQLFDMLEGATEQYQTFQIVGSGIPWSPLFFARDFTPMASGNKGIATIENVYGNVSLVVDGWNSGGGHFAALSVLTNGDSPSDEGLDLSQYNMMDVSLSCTPGMVVEAFMGFGAYDSSQTFLADITCDGSDQTFTFDITAANRTDIQTGLWLHIPVWKNTGLGQTETLEIDLDDVRFYQ